MIRKLSIKSRLGSLLFLSVFFTSAVWAFVLPTGDFGPDESSHLQMVKFLAEEKKIPIFDAEDSLPDLTFKKQLWNDRFRTGAYYSMAYNSPLSYLPYLPAYWIEKDIEARGNVLAMRLVNSLILAGFALVLFLFFTKIGKSSLSISASLVFFVSFIPQLIFSGSYVNIEFTALLLSAASAYILLNLREIPTLSGFFLLGVLLGLLALCKANFLTLVVLILFFALLIIFQKNKQKVLSFLSLMLPIIFLNIYWWARNVALYKDPVIINHIQNKINLLRPDWFLPPVEAGYSTLTIIFQADFFRNTFLGFFAALGRLDIFLASPFYIIFYLLVIFLIAVATYQSVKDFKKNKNKQGFYITLVVVVFLIINFYIFVRKNLFDFSPQGRHLFSTLLPISWLLYNGLSALRDKTRRLLFFLMLVFASLSSLSALWLMIVKYWGGRLDITSNRAILIIFSIIFVALYLWETILTIKGKNESQNSN
jgi:4-amino-4-deoxy-L-arabinose transferase-like glycosyltransferase